MGGIVNLAGRVALVTGAARGQGRAHVARLAADGADVIALDICSDLPGVPYPMATREELEATVAAVAGVRALPVVADVRDGPALSAAIDDAVAELGGLDVVVSNAGVFAAAKAWQTDPVVWETVLSVNLTGAWHTARATVPHLLERGAGAIVFTASIAALKGIDNLAAYAASKHGIVGLMRTLAIELAPHAIRVNAVCPTNVDTPIIHNDHTARLFVPDGDPNPDDLEAALRSVNRMPVPWIDPGDVAAAVAWLVSDEARYVTGAVVPVDAGALLH
jgi:SDR family mycofactocin-dependent oxidoreductase